MSDAYCQVVFGQGTYGAQLRCDDIDPEQPPIDLPLNVVTEAYLTHAQLRAGSSKHVSFWGKLVPDAKALQSPLRWKSHVVGSKCECYIPYTNGDGCSRYGNWCHGVTENQWCIDATTAFIDRQWNMDESCSAASAVTQQALYDAHASMAADATLKQLESFDPEKRREALWGLGYTVRINPRVLPKLLAVLQGDPDPEVRCSAARALNDMGHDYTVSRAGEALDRSPLTMAEPVLLEVALKDPDSSVRLSAMETLIRIGGEQSLETLRQPRTPPHDLPANVCEYQAAIELYCATEGKAAFTVSEITTRQAREAEKRP